MNHGEQYCAKKHYWVNTSKTLQQCFRNRLPQNIVRDSERNTGILIYIHKTFEIQQETQNILRKFAGSFVWQLVILKN